MAVEAVEDIEAIEAIEAIGYFIASHTTQPTQPHIAQPTQLHSYTDYTASQPVHHFGAIKLHRGALSA